MLNRHWIDDWNDILRDVIFPDEELKSLMMIPDGTNIITFIDKYFIRAGYTSKVLSNEPVRIVYGNMYSNQTGNPHVTRNEMSFDIYVNLDHIHDAENDRLVMRTHLIAKRLIDLLTQKRYLGNYRFWVSSECEMGTSTIGYARYNVSFNYMKTY